jgi:hypothetical protein
MFNILLRWNLDAFALQKDKKSVIGQSRLVGTSRAASGRRAETVPKLKSIFIEQFV